MRTLHQSFHRLEYSWSGLLQHIYPLVTYQPVSNVPEDKHARSAKSYLHKFIKANVLNTNVTFSY